MDFEFRKDDDASVEKKSIKLRGIKEEINWRSWVTNVAAVLFLACYPWVLSLLFSIFFLENQNKEIWGKIKNKKPNMRWD